MMIIGFPPTKADLWIFLKELNFFLPWKKNAVFPIFYCYLQMIHKSFFFLFWLQVIELKKSPANILSSFLAFIKSINILSKYIA